MLGAVGATLSEASGPDAEMVRVFVADDHAVVRQGIVMLVEAQADMCVVGEAGDGESAWRGIREAMPDVAVLDVSMPLLNGAQVAERLRAACPGVRVLALSAYGDEAHLMALREAGAMAYVLKKAVASDLTRAIRLAARGITCFATQEAQGQSSPAGGSEAGSSLVALSPREVEIARLVAWGHSNKEIAAQLFLAVKTVEGYKARLMEKLGLSSRVELVRHALKRGWMSIED